ncbi:hypothetical protein BDZ88DRAFT_475468 [Geranomyces variabilis]|nr:hypothetical protein BDZ88DRAFT_475468 [Geranomyces variabilis]KAJ3133728.1 hypothetical protein HDU90_005566 [Geranomyces variabilis]
MPKLILSLGLVAAAAAAATSVIAAPQSPIHRPPMCLNLPYVPNEFGCPPNPWILGPPGSNSNHNNNNNLPSTSGSRVPITPVEEAAKSTCTAYAAQCMSLTAATCGKDVLAFDCSYGFGNAGWAVGYCRSCTAQGERFVDLQFPGVISMTPMDASGIPGDFDTAANVYLNQCSAACPAGGAVTHIFYEHGGNQAERSGFCACDGKDILLNGLPVQALAPKPANINATAPVSAATPAATAVTAPLAVASPATPATAAAPAAAASASAAPAGSSPAAAAVGPSVQSSAGKTRAAAGISIFIAALVGASQ